MYFAINGIPWQSGSLASKIPKEIRKPENLIPVPIGYISAFPSWVLKFIRQRKPVKIDFNAFSPTRLVLSPTKSQEYGVLSFQYIEDYIAEENRVPVSKPVDLCDLMEKGLELLPQTESIIQQSSFPEKLDSDLWKEVQNTFKRYRQDWNEWLEDPNSRLRE